MEASRFEELLNAWDEGEASPEELSEFEALLRSDPRLRRELVHSVFLDVHLYRRYAAATKAAEPASAEAPLRATPRRRRRAWEAAAAILVFAVSAAAVAQLLMRPTGPSHRVLEGEVSSAGRTLAEGELFEVRGDSPATIQFKDGTRGRLDPGSAGTIRGENGFEFVRGKATFVVAPGPRPFRVTTPAGLVWGASSEFSLDLLPLDEETRPELAVAVNAGTVDVDAWGVRDSLGPREGRSFGPPLPPDEPDYYALFKGATFTLGQAIDRALALAPGMPIKAEIEEEKGRVVFAVEIAQGRKVREIALDVRTGEVVENKFDDDDDESKLVASVKVPLKTAIETVAAKTPGRLVKVEVEREGGKTCAEIEVFRGGKVVEVKVDLE